MAKEKSKTKKNKRPGIVIYEIVMYSIVGVVGLWGLVYIVLGLIASYLPVISSSNPLTTFNDTIKRLFGLTPLWWGVIIFAIAALYLVISLLLVNRQVEKNEEKKARREARLAHLKALGEEEPAPSSEEPLEIYLEKEPEPAPEPIPPMVEPVSEPAPEAAPEAPVGEHAPAEEPAPEEPVQEAVSETVPEAQALESPIEPAPEAPVEEPVSEPTSEAPAEPAPEAPSEPEPEAPGETPTEETPKA